MIVLYIFLPYENARIRQFVAGCPQSLFEALSIFRCSMSLYLSFTFGLCFMPAAESLPCMLPLSILFPVQ